MAQYDLAISFVWEYDVEFIQMIENFFHKNKLTTYIIDENNIKETTELVKKRKLSFVSYLDRASDVDENFYELAQILHKKRKTHIFNDYEKIEKAIDKATMHLEFITAGIHTPHTIIIPPHSEFEKITLSLKDLAILGRPFIIKPANTTGGGIGVVTGAESLEEVLFERATNEDDKYLLQQKVYPKIIDGKRAWFRCFWAFNKPIPCWWDDQTHLYDELKKEEIENFQLKELNSITRKIAKLTGLDFFSTEISLANSDRFIVVDYVNDQCDMRPKNNHFDGVPNSIIEEIVNNMARFVKKIKKS